jgi:hypothetical protein
MSRAVCCQTMPGDETTFLKLPKRNDSKIIHKRQAGRFSIEMR